MVKACFVLWAPCRRDFVIIWIWTLRRICTTFYERPLRLTGLHRFTGMELVVYSLFSFEIAARSRGREWFDSSCSREHSRKLVYNFQSKNRVLRGARPDFVSSSSHQAAACEMVVASLLQLI
jgi:hypothetical protein